MLHFPGPVLDLNRLKGPSINYVTLKRGRGGPVQRYHTVFLLLRVIKILTESVTGGGGGVNIGQFWRYIIYGQPLSI